jgi:hypothetical protein
LAADWFTQHLGGVTVGPRRARDGS